MHFLLGMFFLSLQLNLPHLAFMPLWLGYVFARHPLWQSLLLGVLFYQVYSFYSLASFWTLSLLPLLILSLLSLLENNLALPPSFRTGFYEALSLIVFRLTWFLPTVLQGNMPRGWMAYLIGDGILLLGFLVFFPALGRSLKWKLRQKRQKKTYWNLEKLKMKH
ncbi:MAG: hypothetical protein KDK66_06325 [Deltaproteobacteria bacterium]|nr:hypothetical protein [Deltaproteobacteria bacterium]